ncbi:MAG: DUF4835 family protein [Cyclobacteriaceae bacterium]|nr:DUF4835 family protein [Cyclobacteriaceae bacterium]
MIHKLIYCLILVFFVASPSTGQELYCQVIVNADRVQTTERNIFRDMENSFEQFMNNTKWTNDVYRMHERIVCNVSITIESMPSIGSFNATVQIQAARPVYDSNYETLLLNFADREWQFEYVESQPLQYNENTYNSNLVSMLSFYAYIILGLDFDSFGLLAGEPYYDIAQNIVTLAQSSDRPGWQAFDSNRNRYWLVENLRNQQMEGIRQGMYQYHRLGLDRFITEPDEARNEILKVLQEIQKIKELKPNAIIVISFFDAKTDEIASIFSEGNMQVRREAYNILTEIDPTKTEKYKIIIQD